MVDLVAGIRGAVRGGVCVALDGVEGLAAIAAAISNDADTERAFREANAIRCLYCGDSNCPEDDIPEPEFEGGQCFGVMYRVTTSFTAPPIGFQTNEQLVSSRVVGTYRGDRQPNGLTPVGIELQNVEGGPITQLNIASLGDDDVGSFRIVSVVREDGLADDCGDPTPIFPPAPPNIEYNVDITFDDVFGVEVTAPVTINYRPTTVNFNGQLTIPFTVDLSPTFSIRGNVNLNTGDVNFNFSGNFNPGRTDEEPTIEPPPENAPEDPTPEDLEEGFGIAGVFVYSGRTLARTAETQIPSNIAPTLLVPRIGSVQFEVIGGDLRGWLPDIDIKSVSTFIPCPVEWGASRVVVRWDEGWSGQFIPLYRDLPTI